jgi:hypothetical protein
MTHYLVSGDTAAKLLCTLVDNSTGDPIDLGPKTTILNVRAKNTSTILFSITGIDSAPSEGKTVFSFDNYMVGLAPGYYEGEITITNADGTINTVYEIQSIKVRDKF